MTATSDIASPEGRSALRPDLIAAKSRVRDGCVILQVEMARRPCLLRECDGVGREMMLLGHLLYRLQKRVPTCILPCEDVSDEV
jgi:hypothetical protein